VKVFRGTVSHSPSKPSSRSADTFCLGITITAQQLLQSRHGLHIGGIARKATEQASQLLLRLANLHVEVRECYCVLVVQRLNACCKTCKHVTRDVPQVIHECSDPLGGEHLVYLRVSERFDSGVSVCLKLLLCNLKVLLECVALLDEHLGTEHDSLDTALRPGLTLR